MASNEDRKLTGRRDFLKAAGLGTVAGGAALLATNSVAAAAAAPADETKASGYRETDHVKTYYDLARF